MRKKIAVTLAVTLACPALFAASLSAGNRMISTTRVTYTSTRLPASFNGFTIAQVSDLHNKVFGEKQKRLIQLVRDAEPDLIAVTGDIIDKRKPDIDAAMSFIDAAVEIAPVYFVYGNHELQSGICGELTDRLLQSGVIILDNSAQRLDRDGGVIDLLGISYYPGVDAMPARIHSSTESIDKQLQILAAETHSGFRLLLAHRPELIGLYEKNGIDLVLAGHAHGGQIRLPWVGGLYSPDQGFLPQYTAGTYQKGKCTMVVSRGLGDSIFPVRVFNRPELVVVTLSAGLTAE